MIELQAERSCLWGGALKLIAPSIVFKFWEYNFLFILHSSTVFTCPLSVTNTLHTSCTYLPMGLMAGRKVGGKWALPESFQDVHRAGRTLLNHGGLSGLTRKALAIVPHFCRSQAPLAENYPPHPPASVFACCCWVNSCGFNWRLYLSLYRWKMSYWADVCSVYHECSFH